MRLGGVHRDRVDPAIGPDRSTEGMARVTLTVGVPAEIKDSEHRVAITPDGVRELVHHEVRVLVQAGAGSGAGIDDTGYESAGATIVPDAAAVWSGAGLVCKVKEPQESEFAYLREDLILFTYL